MPCTGFVGVSGQSIDDETFTVEIKPGCRLVSLENLNLTNSTLVIDGGTSAAIEDVEFNFRGIRCLFPAARSVPPPGGLLCINIVAWLDRPKIIMQNSTVELDAVVTEKAGNFADVWLLALGPEKGGGGGRSTNVSLVAKNNRIQVGSITSAVCGMSVLLISVRPSGGPVVSFTISSNIVSVGTAFSATTAVAHQAVFSIFAADHTAFSPSLGASAIVSGNTLALGALNNKSSQDLIRPRLVVLYPKAGLFAFAVPVQVLDNRIDMGHVQTSSRYGMTIAVYYHVTGRKEQDLGGIVVRNNTVRVHTEVNSRSSRRNCYSYIGVLFVWFGMRFSAPVSVVGNTLSGEGAVIAAARELQPFIFLSNDRQDFAAGLLVANNTISDIHDLPGGSSNRLRLSILLFWGSKCRIDLLGVMELRNNHMRAITTRVYKYRIVAVFYFDILASLAPAEAAAAAESAALILRDNTLTSVNSSSSGHLSSYILRVYAISRFSHVAVRSCAISDIFGTADSYIVRVSNIVVEVDSFAIANCSISRLVVSETGGTSVFDGSVHFVPAVEFSDLVIADLVTAANTVRVLKVHALKISAVIEVNVVVRAVLVQGVSSAAWSTADTSVLYLEHASEQSNITVEDVAMRNMSFSGSPKFARLIAVSLRPSSSAKRIEPASMNIHDVRVYNVELAGAQYLYAFVLYFYVPFADQFYRYKIERMWLTNSAVDAVAAGAGVENLYVGIIDDLVTCNLSAVAVENVSISNVASQASKSIIVALMLASDREQFSPAASSQITVDVRAVRIWSVFADSSYTAAITAVVAHASLSGQVRLYVADSSIADARVSSSFSFCFVSAVKLESNERLSELRVSNCSVAARHANVLTSVPLGIALLDVERALPLDALVSGGEATAQGAWTQVQLIFVMERTSGATAPVSISVRDAAVNCDSGGATCGYLALFLLQPEQHDTQFRVHNCRLLLGSGVKTVSPPSFLIYSELMLPFQYSASVSVTIESAPGPRDLDLLHSAHDSSLFFRNFSRENRNRILLGCTGLSPFQLRRFSRIAGVEFTDPKCAFTETRSRSAGGTGTASATVASHSHSYTAAATLSSSQRSSSHTDSPAESESRGSHTATPTAVATPSLSPSGGNVSRSPSSSHELTQSPELPQVGAVLAQNAAVSSALVSVALMAGAGTAGAGLARQRELLKLARGCSSDRGRREQPSFAESPLQLAVDSSGSHAEFMWVRGAALGIPLFVLVFGVFFLIVALCVAKAKATAARGEFDFKKDGAESMRMPGLILLPAGVFLAPLGAAVGVLFAFSPLHLSDICAAVVGCVLLIAAPIYIFKQASFMVDADSKLERVPAHEQPDPLCAAQEDKRRQLRRWKLAAAADTASGYEEEDEIEFHVLHPLGRFKSWMMDAVQDRRWGATSFVLMHGFMFETSSRTLPQLVATADVAVTVIVSVLVGVVDGDAPRFRCVVASIACAAVIALYLVGVVLLEAWITRFDRISVLGNLLVSLPTVAIALAVHLRDDGDITPGLEQGLVAMGILSVVVGAFALVAWVDVIVMVRQLVRTATAMAQGRYVRRESARKRRSRSGAAAAAAAAAAADSSSRRGVDGEHPTTRQREERGGRRGARRRGAATAADGGGGEGEEEEGLSEMLLSSAAATAAGNTNNNSNGSGNRGRSRRQRRRRATRENRSSAAAAAENSRQGDAAGDDEARNQEQQRDASEVQLRRLEHAEDGPPSPLPLRPSLDISSPAFELQVAADAYSDADGEFDGEEEGEEQDDDEGMEELSPDELRRLLFPTSLHASSAAAPNDNSSII